ncbi:MAG: alkaline phosphatase family protein, partial [Halobacteriota archaeon]
MEDDTSSRSIVLGFDGVPWEFIGEWAKRGGLENFATLLDEGAAGPLRSTTPPSTPLAWPSISTGVWPDKHGLYGFQQVRSDYGHQMNTSDEVKRKRLWELVSPSVTAHVPMTYPASEVDGTLVASIMALDVDERYTYPPHFAREIRNRIPSYRVSLQWENYVGAEEEFVDDIADLVDARRELMELLFEEHEP